MQRTFSLALIACCFAVSCSAVDSGTQTMVDPEPIPELGFVDEAVADGGASSSPLLRIGLVGSPNFDPVEISETDASAMFLADLLYDGLTEVDPADGTVVPALAEHWLVSQDDLAWTFILRSDASFSNGTPITSEIVKASIDRVRSRGAAGVTSAALEVVTDIEIIDERTLTMHLSEPFAALRTLLASPVLGIVAPQGPFNAWSGSYGVTAEDRTTIRLEATASATGEIDTFEVVIFADADAAGAALAAGEVDIAPIAPTQTSAVLESGASIVSDELGASIFYGMNVAHPSLGNPLFRAAIVRSIDNATIANLRGEANVAPATDVAGVECTDACAYDVSFARDLLAVAYPDGGQPTVPLDYYLDDDGTEEALALEIARQLELVGIETELRGVPFDEYAATVTAGDHGLFRFGAVRGYASRVAELLGYTSTSPLNVTGFSDVDFDAAMELAIQGDPTAQVLAGEILANASVVVPLVRYQSVFGVAPRISGLDLNSYGTFSVDQLVITAA